MELEAVRKLHCLKNFGKRVLGKRDKYHSSSSSILTSSEEDSCGWLLYTHAAYSMHLIKKGVCVVEVTYCVVWNGYGLDYYVWTKESVSETEEVMQTILTPYS